MGSPIQAMNPKLVLLWNLENTTKKPKTTSSSPPTSTERARRGKLFHHHPGERSMMEVSARLRAPPPSTGSLRSGGSLVVRLRPSGQPVSRAVYTKIRASAINNLQRSKSHLELLFCYDKSVPEENIGKPTGIDLEKRNVGKNPPCLRCEAKGAVLCATCTGSGLYVDSILESQGVIVKVRCLGCGGTGNIMCSKCGGRGHT